MTRTAKARDGRTPAANRVGSPESAPPSTVRQVRQVRHEVRQRPTREAFTAEVGVRWPTASVAAVDRGLTIIVDEPAHLSLLLRLAEQRGLDPKPVDVTSVRVFGFARLPRKGEP